MYRAIGTATIPAQATCPACSYLSEGSCAVCANEDTHPGCKGCVDGERPERAWWKSDLVPAVIAGVVVSLAVAIIVPRTEKALVRKRLPG